MEFTDKDLAAGTDHACADEAQHPLGQFAINDTQHQEMLAGRVDDVEVLTRIALKGQSTVIYAAPNTGKTLVTLALLCEAVQNGRVSGKNIYYVNMDDTANGMLEKLMIVKQFGIQILGGDINGFSVPQFHLAMLRMIEDGSAKDSVIVLDTLKKFVDLMDKSNSSNFTNLVRRFVMKGGTLIALAHTNKNPGADGRRKHSGTSDVVDDFDAALMMELVEDGDTERVTVELSNFKKRSNLPEKSYCTYAKKGVNSYAEKFESVKMLNDAEVEAQRIAAQLSKDSEAISAIKDCLLNGVVKRMDIAKEVGKQTDISRRVVLEVLDRYAGTDTVLHRWSVRKGSHNAQIYSLMPNAASVDNDEF